MAVKTVGGKGLPKERRLTTMQSELNAMALKHSYIVKVCLAELHLAHAVSLEVWSLLKLIKIYVSWWLLLWFILDQLLTRATLKRII